MAQLCRRRRDGWPVEGLDPGDVVCGKGFAIARDRRHDVVAVEVIETKDVTELVQEHAADVARGVAPGPAETQRTAIRIEGLRAIKEDVGLQEVRALREIIGDREGARAKGLAKDSVGKDDRVDSITRHDGDAGIKNHTELGAADLLIPHLRRRRGRGVPRRIAVQEGRGRLTEPELQGDGTRRPALADGGIGE